MNLATLHARTQHDPHVLRHYGYAHPVPLRALAIPDGIAILAPIAKFANKVLDISMHVIQIDLQMQHFIPQ